jgi:L,D-peptidoglycan transpeptidase YkuD (ErfK/YbiS/YcfS/YnhG family)
MITVTSYSQGYTYAWLRAYAWNGTSWVRVFGSWRARVGYNGIAPPGAKREGDGRTPSGTYGFGFSFGVLADPGVKLAWRRVHSYDYWDDDSSSSRYNLWTDVRYHSAGANPEPMDNVPAYNYGAVIAYNTARVPGMGSAIFLHVGTGGPTGGCVSLPQTELLRVLRWLNPAKDPIIKIRVK